MTAHGFTHMIEWSNVTKLRYGTRSYDEYHALDKAAFDLMGYNWSQHFNTAGKWRPSMGNSKQPPRMYFKSEKYISLVLMSVEFPA